MVTVNPAEQLRIAHRVGSLDIGKDGDLAVFDGHPMSVYSKCVMTLIEGETEGWIHLEDKKGLSFWRNLLGGCWKKTISRTDQVASVPGWIA